MTTARATVEARLRSIFSNTLGLKKEDINRFSDITVDLLGADSLAMVELVSTIEGEFQVPFSDDEVEQVKTFGAAVELVMNKTTTRPAEQNQQYAGA